MSIQLRNDHNSGFVESWLQQHQAKSTTKCENYKCSHFQEWQPLVLGPSGFKRRNVVLPDFPLATATATATLTPVFVLFPQKSLVRKGVHGNHDDPAHPTPSRPPSNVVIRQTVRVYPTTTLSPGPFRAKRDSSTLAASSVTVPAYASDAAASVSPPRQ
ncbi:hypothetical protein BR93DRAFT_977829 [Coniochaeta sp. PMI_546]|nr:hypothetical protein BR93DRAFT_977829 [Coniochaeta sp. PMI_546]